jgi:hypothetical protein
VADAHLCGTRGEDQQGIDIHADVVDGRVRTIQCRRVARFGKGDAEETIADTTHAADEHVIWATCPLTTHARKVINAANGWDAWDIEQLSSQVRGLPREQMRWLVEDHLGANERRRLLGPESELCIAPEPERRLIVQRPARTFLEPNRSRRCSKLPRRSSARTAA